MANTLALLTRLAIITDVVVPEQLCMRAIHSPARSHLAAEHPVIAIPQQHTHTHTHTTHNTQHTTHTHTTSATRTAQTTMFCYVLLCFAMLCYAMRCTRSAESVAQL